MGLDIYAGTLTRYYTQNWKTAVQQFGEAHGIPVQIIRANPEEHPADEAERSGEEGGAPVPEQKYTVHSGNPHGFARTVPISVLSAQLYGGG